MTDRLIFILDDDDAIRESLTAIFEGAGYAVKSSGDWVEISALVMSTNRERTRAVLIADLNMPGIRGEDFCKTVVAYCKNVTVVLHSGDPELEACARRLGAGVLAVPKGLGVEPLLTAASLALG